MILHALTVSSYALNGNRPFALCEKFRSRREIRKHNQRDDASCNGDAAEYQEHIHPPRKSGGDVAYGVSDQAVGDGLVSKRLSEPILYD